MGQSKYHPLDARADGTRAMHGRVVLRDLRDQVLRSSLVRTMRITLWVGAAVGLIGLYLGLSLFEAVLACIVVTVALAVSVWKPFRTMMKVYRLFR